MHKNVSHCSVIKQLLKIVRHLLIYLFIYLFIYCKNTRDLLTTKLLTFLLLCSTLWNNSFVVESTCSTAFCYQLTVRAGVGLIGNYFNESVSEWEPLIEPVEDDRQVYRHWECNLEVRQTVRGDIR